MMAGSKTLPSKGRIQMRQTNYLQIIISGLQRTAGPYRCAIRDQTHCNMIGAKKATLARGRVLHANKKRSSFCPI